MGYTSVELGYGIAFGIPLIPINRKWAEMVKDERKPRTSIAGSHW